MPKKRFMQMTTLKKPFKETDLKKEKKKKIPLLFLVIILIYLFIIFVPVSDLYNARFIEMFVVLFLMVLLPIIFFISFKTIYNYKTKIISEIRKNKIDYLILLFVVLVGLFLRTSAVIVPTGDGVYYHQIADNIINSKHWYVDDDLPGLPILIILYYVLGDSWNFYAIGSIVGSILSGFTILLIFVWLKILFNNKAGLFGAIALCFSTLNLESSVNGMPFSSSLFFVILGLIFIELAISTGRRLYYFASALALSFSVFFWYVELAVIPIVVIYVLLRKKANFLLRKQFWFFILWAVILLLPFMLLNASWVDWTIKRYDEPTMLEKIMSKDGFILLNPQKILCRFSIKCECIYTQYFDKKHIIKFSSYLLLGKERQNYLPFWPPDSNKRNEFKDSLYPSYPQKSYFEPSYGVYLFFSLIAILGFLLNKEHRKKVVLLLLLFFSFFSFAIMVLVYHPEFLIYAETLGLIPLVAYGAYVFINTLSKNIIIQKILFWIISFFFMLPFIRQDWYSQMRSFAYFNILHVFLINLIFAIIAILIFYFVVKNNKIPINRRS